MAIRKSAPGSSDNGVLRVNALAHQGCSKVSPGEVRLAKRQRAQGYVLIMAALWTLLPPAVTRAEDQSAPRRTVADAVYKGIVGKALDAVPMDPEKRVVLQRTNAVVSNTMTGRSLSVWAGLTNPLLLVGGLVWGLFAAHNIKADEASAKPDAPPVEPAALAEVAYSQRPETGD
jgi:hypothetical protein